VTFICAFTRGTYALVAGDSRQMIYQVAKDGTEQFVERRDDALKVWPLTQCWCAVALGRDWHEHLRPALSTVAPEPGAIRRAMAGVAAREFAGFQHRARGQADAARRGTWLFVGATPTGYFTLGAGYDGTGSHEHTPEDVLAVGVRDVPTGFQQAALSHLRQSLDRDPRLSAGLRGAAWVIHEVAVQGGPEGRVSDAVTFGVLLRHDDGVVRMYGVKQLPCPQVLAATEPELADLLVEIVE
jgi:hypothetical protein